MSQEDSEKLSPEELTIEGYYHRAEDNLANGDLNAAMDDLQAARNLCSSDDELELWRERLEQTFLRIHGASVDDDGPPVCEMISIILPSPLKEESAVMTRLTNSPDLKVEGKTLTRKDHSVVYDVDFLDVNNDWVEAIIEMANVPLPGNVLAQIRSTARFCHVTAPNLEIQQEISSQVELAIQCVHTLEPLLRAVEAPVAVLRGSNGVVTYDVVRQCGENISAENLIAFFVKIMNSGGELFSVGMHQLGFADVEISLALMPFEKAVEVLTEFMIYQVVNNFYDVPDEIEFESNGIVYDLKKMPEVRFNVEGEARHNAIGVWHFSKVVDAGA
jgi:hypothetical protein